MRRTVRGWAPPGAVATLIVPVSSECSGAPTEEAAEPPRMPNTATNAAPPTAYVARNALNPRLGDPQRGHFDGKKLPPKAVAPLMGYLSRCGKSHTPACRPISSLIMDRIGHVFGGVLAVAPCTSPPLRVEGSRDASATHPWHTVGREACRLHAIHRVLRATHPREHGRSHSAVRLHRRSVATHRTPRVLARRVPAPARWTGLPRPRDRDRSSFV